MASAALAVRRRVLAVAVQIGGALRRSTHLAGVTRVKGSAVGQGVTGGRRGQRQEEVPVPGGGLSRS